MKVQVMLMGKMKLKWEQKWRGKHRNQDSHGKQQQDRRCDKISPSWKMTNNTGIDGVNVWADTNALQVASSSYVAP